MRTRRLSWKLVVPFDSTSLSPSVSDHNCRSPENAFAMQKEKRKKGIATGEEKTQGFFGNDSVNSLQSTEAKRLRLKWYKLRRRTKTGIAREDQR